MMPSREWFCAGTIFLNGKCDAEPLCYQAAFLMQGVRLTL